MLLTTLIVHRFSRKRFKVKFLVFFVFHHASLCVTKVDTKPKFPLPSQPSTNQCNEVFTKSPLGQAQRLFFHQTTHTMTNFFTQSTIACFHEKRHQAMAEPSPSERLQAHPHPTTLQSFSTDSTIYRLHADRHHGIIHATSPAVDSLSKGRWPTLAEFCTQSTIYRFHQTRHVALGH